MNAAHLSAEGYTQMQFEDELLKDLEEFYDDFSGWVHWAFDWGNGELADFSGPDEWQAGLMHDVDAGLRLDPDGNQRHATSSGHGIGKTAMVAWIILWAMSTRPHLAGVVTANTMQQLNTKTWRELALWHKRLINRHWFKWSATKFWHVDHPETWAVNAVPNSEHNSEAFAGTHSKYKIIIFDEASKIPDIIWQVADGAMTDPRSLFFVFGNPTQNTGAFRECFNQGSRWKTRKVDSRTAKMTNKVEIAEWIAEYGEDSDFVRVRVRGEFPRTGSEQFISSDIVDFAMANEVPFEAYCMLPPVLGCDVARYGDDKSVVIVRQGRKIIYMEKYREYNTQQLAVAVIAAIKKFNVAISFVDGVGVGAGVVDRLRMLGYEVCEVNAGVAATDDEVYYNKRAEMWGRMRTWLSSGADIPLDIEMREALIGLEYGFDDKERIRLERKKDMKKRGLASPDEGDALAHTFAEEIGDIRKQSYEPNEESHEPEEA